MIVATLFCYFCFLYFYLQKNTANTQILYNNLPQFLVTNRPWALKWIVLFSSLLPWCFLLGIEVGIAAWLVSLSLVALVIVIIYPVAPQWLIKFSKLLLLMGGVFILLGDLK